MIRLRLPRATRSGREAQQRLALDHPRTFLDQRLEAFALQLYGVEADVQQLGTVVGAQAERVAGSRQVADQPGAGACRQSLSGSMAMPSPRVPLENTGSGTRLSGITGPLRGALRGFLLFAARAQAQWVR